MSRRKLTVVYNSKDDRATIMWRGRQVMGVNDVKDRYDTSNNEVLQRQILADHRSTATDIVNDFVEGN